MKQILKTGIPLSLGSLAREMEVCESILFLICIQDGPNLMLFFVFTQGGVLVVFASTMGAAEVAVWTIVRTLSGKSRICLQTICISDEIVLRSHQYLRQQDIFASCMEGICCAAEIRSAYFIGTGNISSARLTSYKSLVIGKSILW